MYIKVQTSGQINMVLSQHSTRKLTNEEDYEKTSDKQVNPWP